VLQSSPYKQPFSFPRRFRRGTRWLVRSLYFPVFLQIRNLPSPVSRSQAHTHLLVPAAHFCARGFATLLHSPRIEGWAERRETFGCSAEHPWGLHMTRQARRLRGALRPMTRQYASRNNVTISIPGGRSVPIVSQTEIDPMKTTLSLMSPRRRRSPSRCPCRKPGPGGSCPPSRAAHSARRRRARRRRLPRSGSIVVDLVEPGWQPLAWPANVVQQQVFRDTVPWVVIRVCS